MGSVYSIRCGLPFCQSHQEEQIKLSIGLRTTAVAIGVIAILVAVLMKCGVPGLPHVGASIIWPLLSIGVALVVLAIALKCVKKPSKSNGSHEQLPKCENLDSEQSVKNGQYENLYTLDAEGSVKNGHGEFVVFSKSGKAIERDTYESAYKIFDRFSIANILNDHSSVETAIEIFGKREESIEQELQMLDSDLSAVFIPRTLYELVFIHACIEEDITAGKICPFLSPQKQKTMHGHETSISKKMSKEGKENYVARLHEQQTAANCWHLCYFNDPGNYSMHPKVVDVAHRLNQLIIDKIQHFQTFTFSNVTALLNAEIEYLETYHRECSMEVDKMCRGEEGKEIASSVTPGPTTHFGYEFTRGSIKPMGIRDQKDADILHRAVAMECSEVALKNIFLFRGSHFTKDQPYCLDNQQVPYSLSFGTSLFSGVVYDGGATAFHYMRTDTNEAFAVIIPIEELASAPFFVPLTSTICQLFGDGEIFHGRSKVWQGVNRKPKGVQDASPWEHLRSDVPREELVSEVQRFYNENTVSMK